MSSAPLVCPGCGQDAPPGERFCAACGMPLVFADVGPVSAATERQQRARKIKKQYSEGPLRRVAVGRHQAEAELISGLLLEHGIPSMFKRSAGFDVPDMLFSGPRDVFVPQSGEEAAREVLAEVEAEHDAAGERAVADGEEDPGARRATRSTRTMAVGLSIALAMLSIVPASILLAKAFT
ncbi:MAG: DUF2007 domain-containing protein [Solirubrobacterales bacterium]|nr:DUF2007 domain-containing protein [Solirubrobacterales bacterium]